MALAEGLERLSSRNLSIAHDHEKIVVSYELTWPMTLGSKTREKDLRRRFKARLQRWFPQEVVDTGKIISACWATTDVRQAKSAIDYLDHMLDSFRKERLIPKIVEEVLSINSQERRRWIKDGRLPKSGTGHFKKGKTVFQFYLHSPEEIAKLAANPEIIAEWRAADGDAD